MGLFEEKQLSKEEKNFYDKFQKEEKELVVLVKEECAGAGVNGDFLTPSVEFAAAIDPETDELKQENGMLCWMIPKNHKEPGWGYNLKQMTIYRVLVRKCYEQALKEYQSSVYNRRWLIVKVIEKIKSEPRLDAIREEYLRPVYIEDEKLGKFTLDRKYGWFDGNIDWLGNSISIQLELDEENASTARWAFMSLKKVALDIQNWDTKIRQYAAKELTELANDWNEEEDTASTGKITEEDFAKRIEMDSITFNSDGSFEITFNDDDMFFGHWVVVYVDENGELESANMEG